MFQDWRAPRSSRGHRPRWLSSWWLALGLFICAPEVAASTAFIAGEHGLAVAAGNEILRQGGNAVDAAVAAAATLGVVNPVSCGLGGGGFMVIYDAATGEAHALDFRETAPAAATPARFLDRGLRRITGGPVSIAVPGEPAGLTAAHERFGSLPLAAILAPAIGHARNGFSIEAHLAEGIAAKRDLLLSDPELAKVFLHSDGTPRERGEHLEQPDLARSLSRLAAEGSAPFYEGEIARAIVTTVSQRGGLLTAEDLAAYRIRWRVPLRGAYRGRKVFTMPPPGSGGVLLTALNVLSAYELASLELGSPTYLHLLADTMKAVFTDRARYYGDPEFVDVPVSHLTSEAHAAAVRARLSPIRVLDASAMGAADQGTAHISSVDARGNAVALTTTINTGFGSGIMARGTGIILNNQMADFSVESGATNVFGLVATEANVVAPNKRPLSSMSPTVLLRRGRPEIVIGGSGGPMIITAVLQTLLALVDFDLDPAGAAGVPRIHHQGVPGVLLAEPGVPEITRLSLARLGHRVRVAPSLGAVSVIRVGPGGALGAGAPRKGGTAAGPADPIR
jgi:gamma-glutamyltranspeptidase/glutathione hydrolase